MSRIGKLPITIPAGVKVDIADGEVSVVGALGRLDFHLPPALQVRKDNDLLLVRVEGEETPEKKALWGLWRSLLNNAVMGVSLGFTKALEMVGLGYRAKETNEGLELNVGFSHPVIFQKPEGIELAVDKNIIKVSGFNKQLVGETAASLRRIKPPEPYKGKGIRYLGEVVRRKAGKATKAAVSATK